MTPSLGVGVVGCGRAAADVCTAVDAIEGAFVAAAFDEIGAAAKALADHRGATVHATLDALFADPAVNIVYVGLPHHLLAGVAEAALRTGKHVLVEKPMALDPEGALELGGLADERNLRLCVFFELRKAGTVQLARQLVAGGAIGDVRAIQIRTIIDKPLSYWQSREPRTLNWRASLAEAGGGVVLMNSIHQFDTVRFVTGLSVTEVMGEIATLSAPVEVEDSASAVMRLSNGGMVSFVAAAHSPGARDEETIGIDGEHGRIEIPSPFGTDPVRLFLRRSWGEHMAGEWIDLPTPRPDFYAAMVEAFVESVRSGSEPPATARDAAAALAMVLAIYQSSRERRAVQLGG